MGTQHVAAAQYRRWVRMQAFTALALALLAGCLGAVAVKRREVEEAVYCVSKPNADSSQLQDALDWTCGGGNSLGSVDCSAIVSGGSCFEPDTLADHASYAFNLYYYHQNAASHACDFNGLATLTSTNPSSGTCVFPTSAASANTTSTPVVSTPIGTVPSLPFLSSPAPSPSGAILVTTRPLFSSILCLLYPLALLS